MHPGRVGGVRGSCARGAAAERAAAQVLQRAARDPQEEEVEDRQESELQPDGDRFEHRVSGAAGQTRAFGGDGGLKA